MNSLSRLFGKKRKEGNDYIDWSRVPRGYNWVALDGWCGWVFAHKKQPILDEYKSWISGDHRCVDSAIIGQLPDYRNSLRKRPSK